MALPLLAGAKGLLAGAAKGGAKKAVMGGAKKFVKGKAKDKAKQTVTKKTQDVGRKVSEKVSSPKAKKIKAIKLPKSVYKSNQSDRSTQTSGKASFESISKQLDNINNTTSTLVKASEAESKAKKEANRELRDKQRIEKARKKEDELEKKKGGGGILSVGKKIGKNFGIFDFLTNVAMGGLVAFLLNNYETIENLFTTLGQNFQNPFKMLKGVITGISSVFAGPIKGIFKTTWKGLSKGGQVLTKKMGQVLPLAKKTFGSVGQGIVNFAKKITGQITGQGTKGVTKQVAKNTGTVASQTSKSLAKTAPKTAAQHASKGTAKNVMGKGATRLLKIGNIFKRVPVVGGLISIFIDMLLGEPLDRAVVGAIGGGIGAWIGGGIGSVVFPFAGTAAGAILGGMIGDWAGKALYELIKEKMGLVPPVDPKDKEGPGGLTEEQIKNRGAGLKPGDQRMVQGRMQTWTGFEWVEPSQYTPPAGRTATSTGTASSGGTRSGASPTGYSSNLGPSSSAQRLYNTLGITASQWKTYKDTLASIETSGYSLRDSYGAIGGSGNLYDGRYQMGNAAKIDAANILGIPVPSRAEFRNNPQLQEDMILAHAVQNHRLLSGRRGSQRYRDASGIERLSYLGFAHNQGWVHAANWLDSNMTKDPTRDGFGTSGTKFTKALRRAFGQPAQTSQSQQTTQPAQLALDVQAQGGTGVIKDMGATTGGRKGDMVSGFPVTSGYGPRWGTQHKGIDIGTPEGTYVALDVDVEIVYSGLHGSRVGKGYGNVVDAWAPSLGLQFRLAHLNKRLCSAGQKIPAGVPLGQTGGAKGDVGRGSSTGPHLHFEVDRKKGGTEYGGSGNPSAYVGHLILSAKGPEGAAPNINAQLSPNQPGARPDVNINRRGSYDQMYGQGSITPIPIPGQQPSGGGGQSGVPMMSVSTSAVVNSYYKSQLMGFLYKQG
jgi:murein DD-endopeptidase MepM/ murein hydrolase activator NlpD